MKIHTLDREIELNSIFENPDDHGCPSAIKNSDVNIWHQTWGIKEFAVKTINNELWRRSGRNQNRILFMFQYLYNPEDLHGFLYYLLDRP